jgi:hypothetical protein
LTGAGICQVRILISVDVRAATESPGSLTEVGQPVAGHGIDADPDAVIRKR